MQYIQLQGQIASQVPTPPTGSVNMFIDSDNNKFGTTNHTGDVTILGGLTTITKAELDTLVSTSALTAGHFYLISGASQSLYGGTDIIIQAVSSDKLDPKGTGLFYNPKYDEYNVWDNHFRLSFNTLTGPFIPNEYIILHSNNTNNTTYGTITGINGNSHMVIRLNSYNDTFFENSANLISLVVTGDDTGETCNVTGLDFTSQYAINDKVIWGNKVWRNLNGRVGSDAESFLALNEEWELVPYNQTDYELVANEIEYDYENDFISFRRDGSNFVRQDFDIISGWWGSGDNQIAYFPWGHPTVKNVTLTNAYQGGLVNTHNTSRLTNISVDMDGRFSFDYCGRHLYLSDIKIENSGYFYNNILPYANSIYGLKINSYAYIEGNNFCDNDNQYDQIYNLELGLGGEIYDVKFYPSSYIGEITIGNGCYFGNINLHQNSFIQNCTIGGTNASLSQIILLNGSYIEYLNLRDNSKIQNGTLDLNSYLESIDMSTNSRIQYFNLGVNSYIGQINMGSNSYINFLSVGDYSNYQDIDLGAYAYMYGIEFGVYSNFEKITLNTNSYIENISMGDGINFANMRFSPSTNCSNIEMGNNTSINSIEVMSDSSFGEISMGNNTSIYDFQIGVDSGFGAITINNDISLNNFEIGVNSGFCCQTFTANTHNITINQSLNNLYTGPIGTGNTSFNTYPTELPYINSYNTIQLIDLTDVTYNPVMFFLDNGDFEGQKLQFILKGNGVYDNNFSNSPSNIQIWIRNARTNNGALLSNSTFNWYPFQSIYNSWRSYATCVWTNGAWTTDTGLYD
jgi:hypothetical protein